jgi:hypothetical protein
MKLRQTALSILLAGVLLSACGGGDDPESETTTTQGPTTSTTSQADLDRPRAQALVLAQSDFPTGWTARAPQPDDPEDDVTSNAINQCTGMPPNTETQVVEVKGNDFVNGRNTVGSNVTTFKTAQLVDQDFAGFSNVSNLACIARVLNTAITDALGPTATAQSTLNPLNGVTTSKSIQFALRLTSTVSSEGRTIRVYSDLLGVKDGRYSVSINVTYFDSPPPIEFDKALLGAATQRLANTPR